MTWVAWVVLVSFIGMTGCYLVERRLAHDALRENEMLRRIIDNMMGAHDDATGGE